jgi:Flp pilus assembly protein TadD
VLEAVRHFRLLDETMRDALKGGAAAATHAYREFRDNPLYASLSTEREINLLAQERLKEGGSDDALLLVRLNLGTYPRSASSHQLLGDILLGRGERDAAIGEYETASALEPRNPYRREVLEKARAAKP